MKKTKGYLYLRTPGMTVEIGRDMQNKPITLTLKSPPGVLALLPVYATVKAMRAVHGPKKLVEGKDYLKVEMEKPC